MKKINFLLSPNYHHAIALVAQLKHRHFYPSRSLVMAIYLFSSSFSFRFHRVILNANNLLQIHEGDRQILEENQ